MKTETITVIIPCFNEEEALPVYYQAMQPVMKQMENIDFELLVIDDGSTDHTLLEMKALHQKDPRCKYFSFSRNFGKEAAIYAGLSNAGGDYVAVMDVDLQDPPSLLPKMYKILLEEEYDSVATRRSDRAGETKWSLRKLFVYSMEGITGFSVAPLSLASVLGLLFCHDHRDHRTDLDLGRPCIRMAFSCLHHLYGKWRAAFMYRNCRTVPV